MWETKNKMVLAWLDTKKFTEKSDFGFWKLKMRAFLKQWGLEDAQKSKVDIRTTSKGEDQYQIMEKTHSTIILWLSDKTSREVAKETTTKAIQDKLENYIW